MFDLHGGTTTRLRQRLDDILAQYAAADVRTTTHYSGPLSVVNAALAEHAEAVVREGISNAVRHGHATVLGHRSGQRRRRSLHRGHRQLSAGLAKPAPRAVWPIWLAAPTHAAGSSGGSRRHRRHRAALVRANSA